MLLLRSAKNVKDIIVEVSRGLTPQTRPALPAFGAAGSPAPLSACAANANLACRQPDELGDRGYVYRELLLGFLPHAVTHNATSGNLPDD